MGDVTRVEVVDRMQGGRECNSTLKQAALKTLSLMNVRKKVAISGLRVLSSLSIM